MSASPALCRIVAEALPGATITDVTPLGPDAASEDETTKATGYGRPLRISTMDTRGQPRTVVFHTATANAFGHDRRADRAAAMLLAYDTFGGIPNHVRALDVGAIATDGQSLTSLKHSGEFYLLTEYAEGHVYADELRQIAQRGSLTERDREHCACLAGFLADLHAQKIASPTAYARAVRDLVGSGEGIFGIIDGYPADTEAATPERLQRIEELCVDWRFRLRGLSHRLGRAHCDFHPFNILFDDTSCLKVLDTSRGSLADPADDVTCLAINYVFFALEHAETWSSVFGRLWYDFWERYLTASGDDSLLDVTAPYLAWRGLVLSNPTWYSKLTVDARNRLLTFIERTLRAKRFDPEFADAVFA